MSNTVLDESQAQGPARLPWMKRPEVRGIFWLWLPLTLVGLALSWVPAWLMGQSVSFEMDEIQQTMTLFTAASAPVGALIWAVMIYSLVKWRYKGDGPPPDDAPDFTSSSPVVVGWVIVSGILIMVVFIWGLIKIAEIPNTTGSRGALPTATMVVEVTGNQWVWNFTYPEAGDVQSDVLYLPVDRTTEFEVTSNDVIHSFWLVEMGVKVDANPGAVTFAEVTPHTVGTYELRCAELCGILHAAMETQVVVLPQEDFDAWVAQQASAQPIEPAMAGSEEGA